MRTIDSNMARDAFSTFIPISVDSQARAQIIFDFFDLFSAIAAHAKTNGLAGLKLSRLAGWWAFEHVDTGWGFDGGYSSWTRLAPNRYFLKTHSNTLIELPMQQCIYFLHTLGL